MNLIKLEESVDSLNKKVSFLQGSREIISRDLNKLKAASDSSEMEIAILDEVITFFSGSINQRLIEVESTISDMINKGLRYIFKTDSISLSIATEIKSSKTQFKLVLTDGNSTSTKLEESFGGGLVSIVSFLFQTVVSVLNNNERLLVFDETLNFVSRSYQPALSEFIKQLCKDMDITLLLITHQPTIMESADKVVEAYATVDGGTKFRLQTI